MNLKDKELSVQKQFKILLVVSFIILQGCSSNDELPIIHNGKLVVNSKAFEHPKIHKLYGNWQFYWKQIPIDSAGNFNANLLKEKEFVSFFPSSWKKNYHPAKGYGTFRLKLSIPKGTPQLTLKIHRVESAAVAWVNGKKVAELGTFSTIATESSSDGRGLYVPLPQEEELDIVLMVSNYHHAKGGGFSYGAVLGETNAILRKKEIFKLIEAASSLFIICISLYHLILFFFTEKKYMIAYFGLLCLTASIRQLFVGKVIIYDFFPNVSFYTIQLFRYLPLYFSIIFFTVYYKHLLPDEGNKWVARTIMAIAGVFLIFAFVGTYESTHLSYANAYLAFISISYTGIITCMGLLHKRELSLPIFISTFIAFAFLLNDILYVEKIIQTAFLSNYGVIIFLLMQSIINYRINSKMKVELKQLSLKVNSLEDEINFKTEEVTNLLTESIHQLKSKKQLTEKLSEIQKETNNNSLYKILAELKSERLNDSRAIILMENIRMLNYNFIKALKTKHPNITKIDVEICSFIRLGLTSLEIARLRGTSKFSVKSSRYRIRKKLKLQDDVRLTDYLNSFD